MNNVKGSMEIKFTGKTIFPKNIGAEELTHIIDSVNKAILSIIKKETPDISIDKSIISLVNIDEGSAKYRFLALLPASVSAFTIWFSSIANNNYEKLPYASIKSTQEILYFTRKWGCVAEFRTQADSEHPTAKITPSTEIIVPELHYLTGETVIYGKIERVGGVSPKVWIRVTNKEVVICDITEELAKKIGHRLYSWVGLSGTAKWNREDYSVESFQIEKITEYQETPLLSAMTELSSIIGEYFKNIDDVVKYVSEIRGGKE